MIRKKNSEEKGSVSVKKDIGISMPVYPAPCLVVGVYDENGVPGGMTAAWGGVCCSEPPCVSVSVQKVRYSYGGIVKHQAFTVNIPSERFVAEMDYFGLFSGRTERKFEVSGLTPRRGDLVNAPLIEEFPISLECRVVRSEELGSHVLFVGQVVKTWALEECLNGDGYPDPLKVRPVIFAPRYGTYYGLGQIVGKAYSEGKRVKERKLNP